MELVYIKTYGCQMNVHETEKMYASFASRDIGKAERAEDADIIILNTCCVREGAETRVIGNLGLVKKLKENKNSLLIKIKNHRLKYMPVAYISGCAILAIAYIA